MFRIVLGMRMSQRRVGLHYGSHEASAAAMCRSVYPQCIRNPQSQRTILVRITRAATARYVVLSP
jgi:hypothetical protein